jgi:hypothetical protein
MSTIEEVIVLAHSRALMVITTILLTNCLWSCRQFRIIITFS